MSDIKSHTPALSTAARDGWANEASGVSAVTEATRQADIIHITLAGMTAIVVFLLYAVALPVFGKDPVKQPFAFVIMMLTALGGIGYLYFQNYRVHRHVSNQARLTEVLVNSLGQGFLSFNQSGLCGLVYSQASVELLETTPGGKNIMDVLRIPLDQHADFKDWLDVLFLPDHALGFDDVVKFLPQFFAHSHGRRVSLMYRPIRNKNGILTNVVAIATDLTEEYEAQQLAQQNQNYADMICSIFKERNQFLATVTQVRRLIAAAEGTVLRADASPILRMLHTLKAAVKQYHLYNLAAIFGRLENDLRSDMVSEKDFEGFLRKGQEEIRVELAIVMKQVHDIAGHDYEGRGNLHEVEENAIYAFAREMKAHNVDPVMIQRYLTTIAAVPINDCFRPFERELNDLSEITGKQVKPIRFTGSNPRVLTQPLQELFLSLTHICRNIIDHGIEPSVTRLSRGKDPAGQISIHADTVVDDNDTREWLHIIISDDGGGIDPSRVRAKLATIDPQGFWRKEDDQSVIQHIFSWGFSTRDNVTDLSGRGVGMEAVEREVKLLGGEIKVYSELYHGARFDIRIPYSRNFEENRPDALIE